MNRVYLCGIASAADNYRIIRYLYIDSEKERITIQKLLTHSAWLKYKNPTIEYVYAVDDSAEMARAYKETKIHNDLENNVIFKQLLEDTGIRLI